jgi:hypothetical protein
MQIYYAADKKEWTHVLTHLGKLIFHLPKLSCFSLGI